MPITTDALREISQRAEALHRQSRDLLTDGVRRAAREGYSQRAIAAAIGRSQPEVPGCCNSSLAAITEGAWPPIAVTSSTSPTSTA